MKLPSETFLLSPLSFPSSFLSLLDILAPLSFPDDRCFALERVFPFLPLFVLEYTICLYTKPFPPEEKIFMLRKARGNRNCNPCLKKISLDRLDAFGRNKT